MAITNCLTLISSGCFTNYLQNVNQEDPREAGFKNTILNNCLLKII